MADRYWRGGTASWDGTAGTKWADSVGGAGGASVPTSADDVYFDATSGANTVTIAAGNTGAKSINCTGFTGTLTGTAAITVSGSVTLVAGMTYSHTGTMTFNGTGTLTTAGKTFSGVTVNGSGITLTLGDALSMSTRTLTVTQGTFTTANFNVTASALSSSNSNTRTITLGSSTVTLSAGTAVNFGTSTNLTFNADTSQITATINVGSFVGGGQTFYNVTYSSTSTSSLISINGANTFNNLTFASSSGASLKTVEFDANQTVSGTLTLGAANTAIRRILVRSDTVGTQRTITLNGTLATLADVDFRDIAAAGSAGTWTGTRIGDCKGNNNITFDAPKTVYWNLAGIQNWSATGWATTNNGTPAVDNFPLAQDTATFTEAGAAGTVTMNTNWNIGTIQMADGVSNRTTAFTIATGTANPFIYGNVTLFSNLTFTGTSGWLFAGQGTTQTITSAGKTFPQPITVNSPSGTFQLADNLTSTGINFTLTAGTLDLSSGNRTLSVRTFSSNNSNTRAILFGSGSIALTSTTAGATVLSMATATGFTWTGTGAFTRNMAATADVTFGTTGGTVSNAPNLTVNAGSSDLTITSGSYFNNVDFTGSTSTVTATYNACGNLTLATGGTYTSVVPTFRDSGTITSTGKTLGSTTVNGSGITVTLGDNLTLGTTRTFTLTQGTLDLSSGNRTLSTGIFSSSNSNTRSISFGSGNIALTSTTAATTVLSMATATNFTWTGTGGFTRDMAATATVNFGATAGGTASNAPNLSITGGASVVTITSGSYFKDLNFTGYGLIPTATTYNASGTLTLSTTVGFNFSSSSVVFVGSGTIKSNSRSILNVTVNGSGITVTLDDALSLMSNGTLTLTQGTFNAANYNVTAGNFSSSNSNTRTLTMGSGSWDISGNTGSVWDITDPTNLTLNKDTANITLSASGTPKTFAGGGQTYNNLVIGGAGTSTLTFTGSNTFGTISSTKTVAHTIRFTNGTTTTVSDWTVTGTSGNVVTINSTSPGSQATLSKSSGSVTTNFMNITDSNATGGARWVALNSINGGNNSGWLFGAYNISGDNGLLFFP